MTATTIRVKGRYQATLQPGKWTPAKNYHKTDDTYDHKVEELNHDLAVRPLFRYLPWPAQAFVAQAQQRYPEQVRGAVAHRATSINA